ncbi:hypothetical protein HGM15179_014213 [Zosterops borbonicus]|uniref:E3 ubiquitin protein ligase n=1 Tax=Zosterops borbonicus TaxID=364589 RepID=A0A8K1G6M8_9PASS|nr:hypothetical protein HGM15179_014213 [Zosterops borbonicus]
MTGRTWGRWDSVHLATMSGIGNKRVAGEPGTSAPPEKKAGVEDSGTTVETIKLGGVSSTEELDIRTLQSKNRKLAEMLDQRQAIEDELREHIEKLERRQATDDASLLIINRYWSQNTFTFFHFFIFPAEGQEPASSFLATLASSTSEEIESYLQERVESSCCAVAQIVTMYDKLQEKVDVLSQKLNSGDISLMEEAVVELNSYLSQENGRLQELADVLQEKHRVMSQEDHLYPTRTTSATPGGLTLDCFQHPDQLHVRYLVDKQFWLVMGYVDGGTLRDIISKTWLSEEEVAAISREVSDAICASQGLGRLQFCAAGGLGVCRAMQSPDKPLGSPQIILVCSQSEEPTSVSLMALSSAEEEAKEEQNENHDHRTPTVVTEEPDFSETVLPENVEQIAPLEMPCQTQGELFPAQVQEEQLRQQVEEPQENEQNIKAEPQAELPEAQSDIKALKRRITEHMRQIQEEMNLHQQRGDQHDQMSVRVVATPLIKHPVSCFLHNIQEQLQAKLQETETRMKTREKRLEQEMKIMRDLLIRLNQALQKQVEVLTSHRAACKGFQQMTGKEEPQDQCEAQERSPPEMLQAEHDLKAVEEQSAQWEEVEHWNKELQVCLQPLEGEKSPWEDVEWSLWQSSFRKSMKMECESGHGLQ